LEVVLVEEGLVRIYDHVLASGWPHSTPLTNQPWGITGFRIVDLEGIYIRVTAPAAGPEALS
jgi:uncharacterized glyoxalase superfamily protein PhnB